MLASVIIEDCLRRKADVGPTLTTAYFYCNSNNSQTTSCIAVLRGLIAQLVVATPDLLPFCHEKYSKSGETLLTSMQLAKQLFTLFFDSNINVAAVIDGLDECPERERKAFLEYMNTMIEETRSTITGKLRVLVVSQQYGDIRRLLSSAAVLTMGVEHNGEDIREYVDCKMTAIGERFTLDTKSTRMVAEQIYSGASGEFPYAFPFEVHI